jgi:hypothetical protein
MSAMQTEVFEAFRAIDIPEDKALKAAAALGRRDDDVVSIKADIVLIKGLMALLAALQVAIFVKLFVH